MAAPFVCPTGQNRYKRVVGKKKILLYLVIVELNL